MGGDSADGKTDLISESSSTSGISSVSTASKVVLTLISNTFSIMFVGRDRVCGW